VPIEPWWETNPATTPRQELGMVSPELLRITAWLPRLSWQGSRGNRRSVRASSRRADGRLYRTAPLNLAPKEIRG
jgi:hypothetical protein